MTTSATTSVEAEIVSSLMTAASAGAIAVSVAARLLPASSRDLTRFMEIAEQAAIRFSMSASAVSTLHAATTATRESLNLADQIANMTATRRVTEQAIAEATAPSTSTHSTIVSEEEQRVTIKNERAVPFERPRRATTAATKRDLENLDTYIEFLDNMRNRPQNNILHEWSFKEKFWLIILGKLFANLDTNGNTRVDWKNGLKIIPLTNVKTYSMIMSHWYSYRRNLKSNNWKCADRIAEKLLIENSEYFYQLKRGN